MLSRKMRTLSPRHFARNEPKAARQVDGGYFRTLFGDVESESLPILPIITSPLKGGLGLTG